MTSKHPRTSKPTDSDLKRNPGIGTSKGTTKKGDDLDGDSTFRGDVESDTTPQGGVDQRQIGRSNK